MIDSATGGDVTAVLNTVLANAAWGTVTVTTDDAAAAEPTWALANPEPSVTAPSPGLKTYAEFMQSLTDTKGLSDLAEIQARKQRKRKALKSFCILGSGLYLYYAYRFPQSSMRNVGNYVPRHTLFWVLV